MLLIQVRGHFERAFLAFLLFFHKGDALVLVGESAGRFSGVFLGRDDHGIVRCAEFEMVFEFSLEEVAMAVLALLVLERRRVVDLHALRLLEIHHS